MVYDDVIYFFECDLSSIIDINNIYDDNYKNNLFKKLNIVRFLLDLHKMLFGFNSAQVFNILENVNNEQSKLLKTFLLSVFKVNNSIN